MDVSEGMCVRFMLERTCVLLHNNCGLACWYCLRRVLLKGVESMDCPRSGGGKEGCTASIIFSCRSPQLLCTFSWGLLANGLHLTPPPPSRTDTMASV